MESDPWYVAPPEQRRDTEDFRRYQRSRRLAQFQRDLRAWQRAGLLDHPRFVARVAYRRLCLEPRR